MMRQWTDCSGAEAGNASMRFTLRNVSKRSTFDAHGKARCLTLFHGWLITEKGDAAKRGAPRGGSVLTHQEFACL